MKFSTLTIITSLILWPVIGSAELFKWTDEQGNLHITDAPPRELRKKSSPARKPSPQSVRPMKATPSPTTPKRSRTEVNPLPESSLTPYSSEDATRLDMVGLKPDQATLTSAWQTFDGARAFAKVPVQRWKDKRGVDHFVDVLPTATSSAELGVMSNKPRLKTQ